MKRRAYILAWLFHAAASVVLYHTDRVWLAAPLELVSRALRRVSE